MDADAYPQEVLADEEPKYLRRQKPLEIKRRKFGRKAWSTYLRVAVWMVAGTAGSWAAYELGHFLLASPEMALIHPEQVALTGNHHVTPASVLEIFAADRGKSVLRIPIDDRRRQIEALPWIEQATVRRALPNRIEVEITERTPVAFVREANDMALVDVHGVILERPIEGNFHFPVVTGIGTDTALEDREKRMQLFSGFAQQIESAHAGALDQVSEVDLADDHDVRATLTGLGGDASGSPADVPVLVHFGDSDFAGRYQTLVEDIGQWRAKAGPVESVDLRFSGEAVVNQDRTVVAQQHPPKAAVARATKKSKL
ncbi:MAG TPA: FtsQ-type POTRA domain-containing protein [Candidatus Acidoferrales bacterium]|jgi:cell division protein FtsQ|nr:FtsQ-type POTRA domain-containing protein [Candidatus Acidoferrales bacterium]